MKFGLDENIIEKIKNILEEQPKVDKAYIFGSRAKGNYRPESDIDIAVKGYGLTVEDILRMSAAIDKTPIGFEVDLVNYDSIKEDELRAHVDRVGIEFYSRWKEYHLDELYEFGSGLSKSADEFGYGYGFLAFKDIFQNYFVPEELTSLVNSSEKEQESCSIKKGDVFLTRTSETDEELGMSSVALKDYPKATFNGFTKRLRPKGNVKILPEYVGFYFRSPKFRSTVSGMSSGTTRASLNNGMLSQLKIAIPPFSEQKAIAKSLISLHNKISLLQHQNNTLESIAEAMFRRWFVEEAEEDWEERSLTEIAKYLNGLALQDFPSKGDEGLPIIKIREMKQGNTENSDICDLNIPQEYVVRNGDVLFSWSGSLEVVLWAGKDGALNQHLFKVTSKEYPKWLYYFATKYHLANFKVVAESKSTTMGHIQRHHLEEAKISVPPQPLLDKLNNIFDPLIIKEINNNRQILSLLTLRDSLLPKLMSGEARVKMS